MAAPIVAVIVGLLTGATLPAGATALLGGAGPAIVALDAKAATIAADMPALCAAAAPAAERLRAQLAAHPPATKVGALARAALARLDRDARIVCAHTGGPNTPAGRLKAAAGVLGDIAAADGLIPSVEAKPAPNAAR
jgi:hypothetical protein